MAQKELNLGRVVGYNAQLNGHNVVTIKTEEGSPLHIEPDPSSVEQGDRFAEDDKGELTIKIDPLEREDIEEALGYTPPSHELYGFELNLWESDPSKKITYIGQNANWEPAHMEFPSTGALPLAGMAQQSIRRNTDKTLPVWAAEYAGLSALQKRAKAGVDKYWEEVDKIQAGQNSSTNQTSVQSAQTAATSAVSSAHSQDPKTSATTAAASAKSATQDATAAGTAATQAKTFADAAKNHKNTFINQEDKLPAIGKFNYGSWKDAFFIKKLRPCFVYFDGTEAFDLCPNNYKYKKKDNVETIDLDQCTHDCTNCQFCEKCTEQQIGYGRETAVNTFKHVNQWRAQEKRLKAMQSEDPNCTCGASESCPEGCHDCATCTAKATCPITYAPGNVMVAFPTVWVKCDTSSPWKPKFYFCDTQLDDTYHAYAHTNYKGEVLPYIYMSAYDGWNDVSAHNTTNTVLDGNGSIIDFKALDYGRLRSLSGKNPSRVMRGYEQILSARRNNPLWTKDYNPTANCPHKDTDCPKRDVSDAGNCEKCIGCQYLAECLAANDDDLINDWDMNDYSNVSLIQLLTLLIGRTTNTQAAFGNGNMDGYYTIGMGAILANKEGLGMATLYAAQQCGCTDTEIATNTSNLLGTKADESASSTDAEGSYSNWYDYYGVLRTGTMDEKGMFWGSNTTSLGVKMFGIENVWGNVWKRTWGLIANRGDIYYKLTRGPYDGTTGYEYAQGTQQLGAAQEDVVVEDQSTTPPNASHNDIKGYIYLGEAPITNYNAGAWITDEYAGEWGLIPRAVHGIKASGLSTATGESDSIELSSVTGSSTTYFCDMVWGEDTQCNMAIFGGHSDYESHAGALSCALSVSCFYSNWCYGAVPSLKKCNLII